MPGLPRGSVRLSVHSTNMVSASKHNMNWDIMCMSTLPYITMTKSILWSMMVVSIINL